jgi:4'-phosphopantetheinyl transferase
VRQFQIEQVSILIDEVSAGPSEPLILAAARASSGIDDLRMLHHCPRCGSSDHGRPIVETTEGVAAGPQVSFSRSSGFAAAAAVGRGKLGVDIESIAGIARHSVEEVLLHPGERDDLIGLLAADRPRALARLWVAKEAVLKATGEGLRREPRDIRLRLVTGGATVVGWPPTGTRLDTATIRFFDINDDVVGAIALGG